MRFENLKVGSTYELAGSAPRKVMFLGAYYAVVELEGYPYPTTFSRDDRYGTNPFKNWVLVKPKVKICVELWWNVDNKNYFTAINHHGLSSSYYVQHPNRYKLIKSWVEDIDDPR